MAFASIVRYSAAAATVVPFIGTDLSCSYHNDMDGNGIICLAVEIILTEFAKEATQHFGDILSQFIGILASTVDIKKLPSHLKRACIVHQGSITPLYEYIPRMRKSDSEEALTNCAKNKHKYNIQVRLSTMDELPSN
ncbi:hypothetical protein ACFE04_020116 [Oxalis oulophora]